MIERINARGLSQPPGYSHVTVASGRRLVITAGAVPLDADGRLVGPDDYVAQAERVLANLITALESAGATGDDVLKTTIYVASSERSDLVAVWGAVQRSPVARAASTLLGVSVLGYEGQLVEVEAVAAVG